MLEWILFWVGCTLTQQRNPKYYKKNNSTQTQAKLAHKIAYQQEEPGQNSANYMNK